MPITPEIKLLKGFCSVTFGETQDNIKKVFGEPEEVQTLHDEVLKTSSTVYHYWDSGYSLFFDSNKNQTFCSAEIDNRDTLLFGEKIFTLNEKQFIDLMHSHGFKLTDTETHEWGEKRLSFDEVGLDAYFENNKLVSINFGIIESDDNFYYYPN